MTTNGLTTCPDCPHVPAAHGLCCMEMDPITDRQVPGYWACSCTRTHADFGLPLRDDRRLSTI